jgi:two-component system, cell cycle sensor histidine kinase and response regulator CckA
MADDNVQIQAKPEITGPLQAENELKILTQKLRWTQKSQSLAVQILTLPNSSLEAGETIRQILGLVKECTGFEAVGIRLRDGDDYPYFEMHGFPGHFVHAENSLCARNEEGEIMRNSAGYPIMECMCGNILQGRTDPALPFFTKGGSFWSNCTTELLASTTEQERQARTINRCNGEGYESVALIPLRSANEIIGLLQLNDSRKNCFTLDMIEFFEGIAAGVGIVLFHKRTEQERDRLFNLSIDMMGIAGFDGFYKDVNPAFTKSLGWAKEEFLSKPWIEFVHPNDREESFEAEERLKSGEPLYQFRNRCLNKDGTYRWISWDSLSVGDEQLIYAVARDVTERKQTEEALWNARDDLEMRSKQAIRNSEKRYRSLFKNMLDGFAYCKMLFEEGKPQDFIYLEVNDSFQRLTGLKDVVGKRVTEVIPGIKESNPDLFEVYGRVALTGNPEEFETYVEPLGIWFSISVYSTEKEHFVAVFDNITERKKAEEELRRSETLLRNILSTSPVGIVGLSRDRTIQWVNDACLKMFGFETQKEVVGRSAEVVYPSKEEYQRVGRILYSRLESGETASVDAVFRRKDGALFDGQVTIKALHYPELAIAAISDVSERAIAERAVRESEERYRQAYEKTPVMMQSIDRDAKLVSVSDYWLEALGYEKSEVIGHNPAEFQTPQSRRYAFEKAIPNFLKTGISKNESLQFVKKNGDVIDVLLTATAERDDKGEIVRSRAVLIDVTEQKRAEQDLRDSEERYRGVFENVAIGIDLLDRAGKIIHLNQALLDMLGYTREEISRLTFLDITHPEDRDISKHYLQELQAGNTDSYRIEKRYLKKDGNILWADLSTCSIRDPNGYFKGAIGVIADITERKRAEEELRQSEERYRTVADFAYNWEYWIAPDDKLLYVSPSCERITGYSAQEFINDHSLMKRIIHPDDLADMLDHFHLARKIQQETTYSVDFRILHKNGEVRWINHVCRPVYGEEGKSLGRRTSNRDITEGRLAEFAQKRLATAVEQAAEAIVITDTAGKIEYVNPAFEKITGYIRAEAINQNPRILKSGEHGPTFYKNLWETINRGEVWTDRFINKTKDGKLYWEDATISPVRDSMGKIINFVAVKRDVTENLQLSQQLLQAQKMEAIGILAGGIAHDFNNLLQVTLGYSELMLSNKSDNDPDCSDLRKIYQAALSGAELVKNILTFSRKTEPKPIPMNLNTEIRRVEKLLRRTIPKMIDLRLDLVEDLVMINADPAQIEQTMMNIAVNAKDSMGEQGSLTIRSENISLDDEYCRSKVDAKPGDYVLLSISDTGHGMDQETLRHIFEPFFTTKELGRGTGLGLAMVYGIVKQHGGHIDCYSEIGKGTTFKLYFPALTPIQEHVVEDTGIMPAFGTETVLIVDDEDLVRELGERILSRSGYTVLIARNGEEALDIYAGKKGSIDLTILDLIMPTMGGKDCLKQILELNPDAKILIASGYSGNASKEECFELGAKGFVTKPFRFKELLRQVRKTFDEDSKQ